MVLCAKERFLVDSTDISIPDPAILSARYQVYFHHFCTAQCGGRLTFVSYFIVERSWFEGMSWNVGLFILICNKSLNVFQVSARNLLLYSKKYRLKQTHIVLPWLLSLIVLDSTLQDLTSDDSNVGKSITNYSCALAQAYSP